MFTTSHATHFTHGRFEAHVYAIQWYEMNTTPAGLQLNSVMLYQQCLSINRYFRASKFLFISCQYMLRKGQTNEILQLLVNCDVLLEMWKNDIMAEYETKAITESTRGMIAKSASSLGSLLNMKNDSHRANGKATNFSSVIPISGGGAGTSLAGRRTTKIGKSALTDEQAKSLKPTTNLLKEISVHGSPDSLKGPQRVISESESSTMGRKDSFTIFDKHEKKGIEQIAHSTLNSSSRNDLEGSIVLSILTTPVNPTIERQLLPVAYCENRLKFFEAQVYIETRKYSKVRRQAIAKKQPRDCFLLVSPLVIGWRHPRLRDQILPSEWSPREGLQKR